MFNLNINRFSFGEKDIFIGGLGAFLIIAFFFKIPVLPFRFESLVVVFLFLLITRSLIENIKFNSYLIIAMTGLLLSTFLSPYGLLIYYIIALVLYKKTNLL